MEHSQLKWACRRGMLELDLILFPFFEKNFLQFSLEEKKIVENFLTEADQDLYAWILGFKKCEHREYKWLLERIDNSLCRDRKRVPDLGRQNK